MTAGYPALEDGQVVVLELDDRGETKSYPTRVAHLDGDVVWIEAPAEYALPVALVEPATAPPASEIVIHTWRRMDARYTVRARLTAARTAPRPRLGVVIVGGERIQDREYFRVPLAIQAQATGIGPDGETWLFALTVHDLSAAGLRARSQIPLATDAELRIALRLPDPTTNVREILRSKPLNLRARVVRLIEPPRRPDLSCEIGVSFVDLPSRDRERIIRFALETQRERRRRGSI